MVRKNLSKALLFLLFMGMLMGQAARAQFSNPAGGPLSASTVPQTQLMQPGDLMRLLKGSGAEQPVVFQVGSFVMFQQAHIPNAGFAGPGSQASGIMLLKKFAAPLKKNQLIVIYCGCCPWNRCPNIGPAYKELRDLGFTNVKALYLASNFGDDWVAKGYSTERGE
jgi:thiosulfate/3-mercaptopyruvate sulfurtransferase